MSPELIKKRDDLAEKSVNRNMLELHEADGRVRHFKSGFNAAHDLLSGQSFTDKVHADYMDKENTEIKDKLKLAQEVIAEMESALEFYAAEKNWDDRWVDGEDNDGNETSGDCNDVICNEDVEWIFLNKIAQEEKDYEKLRVVIGGKNARQTLASARKKMEGLRW